MFIFNFLSTYVLYFLIKIKYNMILIILSYLFSGDEFNVKTPRGSIPRHLLKPEKCKKNVLATEVGSRIGKYILR